MHKGFLKTASLIGTLSVALGAFAAHALKESVSDYAVSIFETGVRYQFYHAFALLASGILYKEFQNKFIKWSGKLFIAGIILFSGSLYILTFIKAAVKPGYDWVGAITPVGGLCFIAGWIFLFFGIMKKNNL
ncbi:MAG: DUF423 domain-containing protein [Bacteroidota bacterium]|nr:DUF423 domain-containing protein [Bacteroidota bacterium]MDQ6903400.1 DUF423 domain-containing protein [Bacteroidota bacterium]